MKYLFAIAVMLMSLTPGIYYNELLNEIPAGSIGTQNIILPVVLYVVPTLLIWRGLLASVMR